MNRLLAAIDLIRATDQFRELHAAGRATPEDGARVVRARCLFDGVPVLRESGRWGNNR